jgi:hypothetical protein
MSESFVSPYAFQSLLLPDRSICRLGVNCEATLVAFILSPGDSSEARLREVEVSELF